MANAIITAAIAPLYTAPETQAELADEALCGWEADVLEEAEGFFKISTSYGYEGFVPADMLEQTEELVAAWQDAPKKVVMQPYMDIQAEPKVQAPILFSVTRGALVSPTEKPVEGWQKVLLPDGRSGWCWADFLGAYKTTWSAEEESALRKGLVNRALSYLGVQYRWGGKTPLGIDCSGLCFMAYWLNGVVIWRDAAIKEGYPLKEISLEQAQPGDLLFFPGHVAMLISDNRYIHSTAGNHCHGVVINSLDPKAPDYRADLPEKLTSVGSLFA